MARHRHRSVAALVVAVSITGACSDDDTSTSGTTTTTEPTTSIGTSTSTASTTSGPVDPVSFPGEVIETFPYEGAEMAVVGVEADDVLNLRAGPGVEFEVVATLDPTSDGDAVATGANRLLEVGAIWAELRVGGVTGWANSTFLLQSGLVDDVTTQLYPTPGDRPEAETLVDLARAVADDVASVDPRSVVTIVEGPTVGDLGEVTVDVIGIGDDSVGGYRLHIFAEEGPDVFTVRTVEQTTMCSRGADATGLCL